MLSQHIVFNFVRVEIGRIINRENTAIAEWLKEFVKEVPIEFIAAAEPFWRPDKPVVGSKLMTEK